MTRDSDAEVIFAVDGPVATITLNRPKALNALSLSMIREIDPKLRQWAVDPDIAAVIIKGAGDKAFCAGGDVRAVYQSVVDNGGEPSDLSRDFFAEEYRLNRLIHRYQKPYIALIDGITMGGGVGLSRHGHFRVAGDRTMIAMPETGIGLFPDVGGTWFLPRCPGRVGEYLALTGNRLHAADALYTGLAGHFVASERHAALESALVKADWGAKAPLEVARETIEAYATAAGPAALAESRDTIDKAFDDPRLETVMQRFEAGDDFARETARIIRSKCPTSVRLTHAQMRRGEGISIEEALRLEYRMTQRCMRNTEFFEGIRALLVEKDHDPKWQPDTLEAVPDALIESHFERPEVGDLVFED